MCPDDIKIHTVGIGSKTNDKHLKSISWKGNGSFIQIKELVDIDEEVKHIYLRVLQ